MALLKLGAFVTNISGKIGGSIFGTSSNGSYMKSNSYSQNPSTLPQQQQKNKIFQTTQLWRTLSNQQQLDWAAIVGDYPYTNRLGDTVFYTAFQLFNKLNANLLLINQPVVLDAPVFAAVNTVVLGIFSRTLAIVNISLTGWLSDYDAVVQTTPVYANNETFKTSNFRFLQFNSKNPTNVLLEIDTDNLTKSEPIAIGHYFWLRIKTVHKTSGNTSVWSEPLYVEFV